MKLRSVVVSAILMVSVLGGETAVGGGNEPVREVFVKGETTFQIHPERGYNQYHGDLDYTKVTAVTPNDAKVPKGLAKKARKKCEDYFVNGDANGRYPGFKVFYDDGQFTNLNISNWKVIRDEGKWVSKGFNHKSGEEVFARGAFWDVDYNFQRVEETTTFQFKGRTIHTNCDAEVNAKREYP